MDTVGEAQAAVTTLPDLTEVARILDNSPASHWDRLTAANVLNQIMISAGFPDDLDFAFVAVDDEIEARELALEVEATRMLGTTVPGTLQRIESLLFVIRRRSASASTRRRFLRLLLALREAQVCPVVRAVEDDEHRPVLHEFLHGPRLVRGPTLPSAPPLPAGSGVAVLAFAA